MPVVARAVKRRQKGDFMIAMTKFCGLFGVLEIYVSWVWDGMVKLIFDHHQHHHSLSGMRPSVSGFFISCWVVPDYCFLLADTQQFLYRQNAIFHSLRLTIELLLISINFPFFVYLIFVQLISSLFSLIICFGTSVNSTLGFLVCSLTVISFPCLTD